LHPYFENISAEQWLKATVLETTPCTIRFFPDPPQHWGQELQQRLLRQFEVLGLAKLYGSQAGREISDIRAGLHRHFVSGGQNDVQSELAHQWNSRRQNQINSWKTALYEALKDSEWFCAGGYQGV
jgi:hypothetical protein